MVNNGKFNHNCLVVVYLPTLLKNDGVMDFSWDYVIPNWLWKVIIQPCSSHHQEIWEYHAIHGMFSAVMIKSGHLMWICWDTTGFCLPTIICLRLKMVLLFFTSSWLSSSPVKLPYWLGYSLYTPFSDILIWYGKHISTKFYQATNLQVTSWPSRWWFCIWCQHQSDWVWKCCEKRFHPMGLTIQIFAVVWWPSIPGISKFLGQSLSWIIIPYHPV